MNIHKNARLTPFGRERLVAAMVSGQTPRPQNRRAVTVITGAAGASKALRVREN